KTRAVHGKESDQWPRSNRPPGAVEGVAVFSASSRYTNEPTYVVETTPGVRVTACRMPVRDRPDVRGFQARMAGHRLDHLAAQYLADATAFWSLCDTADAIAPDALGSHELIAIPTTGRRTT